MTPPSRQQVKMDSEIKKYYSTKEGPKEQVFVAASPGHYHVGDLTPNATSKSPASQLRNKTAEAERQKLAQTIAF